MISTALRPHRGPWFRTFIESVGLRPPQAATPASSEERRRHDFLCALRRTSSVEWRHEIQARWMASFLGWLGPVGRVLVAVLGALQVRAFTANEPSFWMAVAAAAVSVLNLILPKLVDDAKFRQRQIVHDRRARLLEAIEVELLAGLLTLEQATRKYTAVIRTRPETEVRRQR